VELAIVLPVLVTLVLAAVDFGRFAASLSAVLILVLGTLATNDH
jgi:Flp pilus assembly protein TadG